jgi:methyltransferase (TIGR00027 family)
MDLDGDRTKRSTTALGNLAMACIANSERDPDLRNNDPVAPRLLRWTDGRVAAARPRFLHPAIRLATERIMPGIYGFALARIKHMDLIVRQESAAGIETLVILGAGYDTRAYRMQQELLGIRVFEVDHPTTSRDKQRRLARALRSIPENVVFVELDLTRQDLLKQLAAHGHQLSTRTLFLLSGVSMYLPEHTMLKLLDQVAAHCSNRSSILFDYINADALVDPGSFYGKEWLRHASKVGEEPVWGIRAGEARALLEERELSMVADLDADELAARYLRRSDGSTLVRPFQFGAIAHASAPGGTRVHDTPTSQVLFPADRDPRFNPRRL